MYNMIELFCGSGEVNRAFNKVGFNTFSIDIRQRKGVCEPDLRQDILSIKYPVLLNDIQKKYPNWYDVDVIFASVPCEKFSIAANGNHFNGSMPKTEEGIQAQRLLKKTIQLIEEIKPTYFFIENPRGAMRYNKEMIKFLIRNRGTIIELFWGAYNFPTPKPTNIFTNAYFLPVRPPVPYGRGFKSNVNFDNLTTNQRQSIPVEFCDELAEYMKTMCFEYEF